MRVRDPIEGVFSRQALAFASKYLFRGRGRWHGQAVKPHFATVFCQIRELPRPGNDLETITPQSGAVAVNVHHLLGTRP
jgi:hypothetical protein